jgi:hypothetical protein
MPSDDDGSSGGGTSRRGATNSLTSLFPDAGVSSLVDRQFNSVEDYNNEIMRETGFAREKDAFDLRVQALTDVSGYNEKRSAALDSVGATVQKSYQQTYELYRQSGESHEKAKAAAKSAGLQAKQLGMKQFHVRFPDSDVLVYTQQKVKEANQFVR